MVVDDEPDLEILITQKYRKKIRNNEVKFIFANNGIDALKKLENNGDIDILLTDINMPEMDGLTLLAELNATYPLLKSVIISAYGDMPNIRLAFNRGAFDFLTKPIDFEDLEITIDKTLNEARIVRQAIKDRDRLVAIQNELDVAREIQKAMVPQKFPPFPDRNEFDIIARMKPAKKVGGDFYDFFFIDDIHMGFAIGDVSGKGVPAALFMAVCRTLLKATALENLPPDVCLTRVNKLLCAEKTKAMFVTIFYGILNTRSGEIQYSNGGHNPPFVITNDGKIRQIALTDGFVVGAISASVYKSNSLKLNPGDRLFMHTDGVTEAMNSGQEMYMEDRLGKCLQRLKGSSLNDMLQGVLDDIREFTADTPQLDDITMMALKYL